MAFSDAKLKGLGEVLNAYQFEIPDYQRGYAWQEPQWKALWQDLNNACRTNASQHFTGTMLLRPCKAESNEMEVVDGQQRLISVVALANALRSYSGQAPVRYPITFRDNEDLQNYFELYALANYALDARLSQEPSSYALNIKEACEYFSSQIKELSKEEIEYRLQILMNNFRLFVLEVSPEFDIHIAFETLNNRGRRLSQMELLKNRLIYLTTVLEGANDEAMRLRKDIHAAWKGIYRALGRSIKTQNHDDDFLLAHTTAYFKKKREAKWLDTILFDTTFSVTNRELNFDFIRGYIASLERGAAWWSHIHAPTHLPRSHQRQLERITHSDFAYFKPLILAAYMRAARTHSGAVARPVDYEESLANVVDLLEQIERFVVLIFRLLRKQASLGRADMEVCAYVLLEPNRNDILNDQKIQSMDDTSAIALVTSYVKAWIDNVELDDGTYSDNRFQWQGFFNVDDVRKSVEQRFRDGDGYYKWPFSRIVLAEYEDDFRYLGNNPIKVGWEDFSFDETVEHIYPQNPDGKDGKGKGKEYWDKYIPIDGRSNRDKKVSKALQNSIGNLLFLSRSANSSASNEAYAADKNGALGKRDRFKNASYSATEVAQMFEHWNAINIAVRGVTILKFVERRWKVQLTNTPDEPLSYLPLCFGNEADKIKQGAAGKKITAPHLKASNK